MNSAVSSPAPAPPLLEMDSACGAGLFPTGRPLRLTRGAVWWVDGTLEGVEWLFDVAQGLKPPGRGQVAFEGTGWADRPPADAIAARGRMRRIFSGPGFLSNLDVDENILLAARMERGRSLPALRAEAEVLARALSLPGLPELRPAWASADLLRRAQWVRLLMGTPDLLLVHAGEADACLLEALDPLLEPHLDRGAGLLWAGRPPPPPGLVSKFGAGQITLNASGWVAPDNDDTCV